MLRVWSQSVRYVKHLTVHYGTQLCRLAKRYHTSATTPATYLNIFIFFVNMNNSLFKLP